MRLPNPTTPATEPTVTPDADIVDPAAGCNVPGCLASLTDKGRGPGVVVIQDDLGLTSDLKRITDRFAANVYLAMARRSTRVTVPTSHA